jgi:hypothetical protein
MIPFHDTIMGRRFYESYIPELVKSLQTIGKELGEIKELIIVKNNFDEENIKYDFNFISKSYHRENKKISLKFYCRKCNGMKIDEENAYKLSTILKLKNIEICECHSDKEVINIYG